MQVIKLIVLIDHRNVPWNQVSLSTLLSRIAGSLIPVGHTEVEMEIRAYGGWFEGAAASTERFEASAKYQADLPSLVKIDGTYLRIQFAFADTLLQRMRDGDNVQIQNTVVARASAQTTVPIANATFVCGEPDCELKRVRRWISRKAACVKPGCSRSFSDYWLRTEQKQVDTHITCDLIVAAWTGQYEAVVLVSDDLDFLPSLATAAIRSTETTVACMRFSALPQYLDPMLLSAGVKLLSY